MSRWREAAIALMNLGIVALCLSGCGNTPKQSKLNNVGGATVDRVVATPLAKMTTSLPLNMGPQAQPAELLIASVISYGGPGPTITSPFGWELIRDDASPSTRQSIYARVGSVSKEPPIWRFSRAVDVQGVVLVLNGADIHHPIDASSGNAGTGIDVAPSLTTKNDGDFIIALFATDFGGVGLRPKIPAEMIEIANQESTSHEYWIIGSYQPLKGASTEVHCPSGQLYNSATAQLAIKRRGAEQ